jgi:ubiquinol-cytochrome c reductase cytochrome b subunit
MESASQGVNRVIPAVPRPLSERLALGGLDYEIPAEAQRWPYMLGGLTAFFLIVLLVTGLYLTQFYDPTPRGAHDSVLYIITRAPFGDWARSLHYWSAGALTLTVIAHLIWVFWRRSYRRPREVTWWAGAMMAGLVFFLLVTGTVLRYDQEGFEAMAHFVAGGELTGAIGAFFTDAFTRSTSLLARIYALHIAVLPLAVLALMSLHFWLIRRLGIHSRDERNSVFRRHLVRLAGVGLIGFAAVGVLALALPEGLGYPAVPGAEVTKPFWPLLWVYGLENLLGAWGMVLGPATIFVFLMVVPLLDRRDEHDPGHGWLIWAGTAIGALIIALWLYGWLGEARQHLGM